MLLPELEFFILHSGSGKYGTGISIQLVADMSTQFLSKELKQVSDKSINTVSP